MSGLITVLVFAGVASPMLFRKTRNLAGNWIANMDGVPSAAGLLLHGVVFVLIMRLLRMLFGRKSGYLEEGGMKFMTRDDQDDQNNLHFQQDRFVTA